MPLFNKVTLVTLSILYPLLVYFGIQHFNNRYLLLILALLVLVRLLCLGKSPLNHWLWLPLLMALGVWAWLTDSTSIGLKLYPVLVSLSALTLFFWSLWNPPTIIERIARLQDPDLPQEGVSYTRTITKIWCWFFALNAIIALSISLFSSDELWLLYNGLISYICMGILFVGEWLARPHFTSKVHD